VRYAVLAIIKNEQIGLREWITHYLSQGVDEILLLDNASEDASINIAQQFAQVTVLPAPLPQHQVRYYNELGLPWLRSHHIDAVIVVDADEYMFGKDGRKLVDHATELFRVHKVSQVCIPWTLFGSSGYTQQPESIRTSFVWRKKNHSPCLKSIVKVASCISLGVHKSLVHGPSYETNRGIQLNHYVIQSKLYFQSVKMTRGDVAKKEWNSKRTWDYFARMDYREVQDTLLKDIVERNKLPSLERVDAIDTYWGLSEFNSLLGENNYAIPILMTLALALTYYLLLQCLNVTH
jgi:hypothetical protein